MSETKSPSTVILVPNNGIGHAEPPLQRKLFGIYLKLLDKDNRLPTAICFYTAGVKLVTEGSSVIDELKTLETKGVQLIICRTCLDYYGLSDKVEIGHLGGMKAIIKAQWEADKVITL